MKTVYVIYVILVIVSLKCVNSQLFPKNPCPNLFKYLQENGTVYGRLEFPNDRSGYYALAVNMSVATSLAKNQDVRLELRTSASQLITGQPVVYNVYFPIQDVIPKLTRIEFNKRVYCRGPPEQVPPGKGVTNTWSTTYFGITTSGLTKSNLEFDIEIKEMPINTIPFVPSLLVVSETTIPTSSDGDNTVQQCGRSLVNVQPLAVNGGFVQEGEFPWMVAIMYKPQLDYEYRCTGNLVSNRHVITAAHCIRYSNASLVPVQDLLIVFGKVNLKNWKNETVIRYVRNIIAHPDYKQGKGDADIAVLTLKEPVEFETLIQPVCLWQEDSDLDIIVDEEGTMAGWGRDESGSMFVTDAEKISLPVVSQDTCLYSDIDIEHVASNRTFCAGKLDGSGPCTGDSGSGFIMKRDGKWTLRGVVSVALKDTGTCALTRYSVFADVAKFRNWLTSMLV